ncbi:cadherin-like protein 26 [Xenentodon cancila]
MNPAETHHLTQTRSETEGIEPVLLGQQGPVFSFFDKRFSERVERGPFPARQKPPASPRRRLGATDSPAARSLEEPRQLGDDRISKEERQRRRHHYLCFYCGQAGHLLINCPLRPNRPGLPAPEGSLMSRTPVNPSSKPLQLEGTIFLKSAQIPVLALVSGNHKELLSPYIISSPSNALVLGLPWLSLHNPHLDWSSHSVVATAALAECQGAKSNNREKRDLLVRSKRRWVLSTIELEEEMKVDYPYKISTMFNDKTSGVKHAFIISGDGVDEGLFSINETTGDVFVHGPVDREKKSIYHIKFDVYNKNTNTKIDKELSFDVQIKDINDNPPRFIRAPQQAKVNESAEEGFLDVLLEATDIDKEKTDNSTFTISVVSQTPKEPQILIDQIDERMGRFKLKGCFDYDKAKRYTIVAEAKDKGKPPLSSTTAVTLDVIDTNSHPPIFKKLQNQPPIEVMEMTTHNDLLRIAVEDKDTPHTDGWRAIYYFIGGNEDQMFSIKTDPTTNEGILSIVKEKNYEVTTLANLQIGVKNAEPMSLCKDGKLIRNGKALPLPDSMNVTVKIIDSNDPPVFEKVMTDVYQKEETEPGQELYTPKVHDADSTEFRFKLIEDPADWVTIDEKTGKITTIKRMDRESPFVDDDNVYKVVIAAIDNGEPEATSSCTIRIHLKDINDNYPKLVNNSMILCGNSRNKVIVSAEDADASPFKGPFTFSLEDNENMKQYWKLDPSFGEQAGLVLLKSLPYDNYSVPLVIQDQQNMIGRETLHVVLCDCEDGDVCRAKKSLSSNIGYAGIGLIIAGLLLFLLLLLALICNSGRERIAHIEKDEGHQTLIKYNEEGGGVACTTVPSPVLPIMTNTVADGFKPDFTQRQTVTDARLKDEVEYKPYTYAYEGQGSVCQSLDELSVNNGEEGQQFLDDIGPRFKTLAEICNQSMQAKKIHL